MSYFSRTEELAACKAAVLRGLSIDVVGRIGSGRTTLLKHLAVALEGTERRPLVVSGISTSAHRPFSALELAGLMPAHDQQVRGSIRSVVEALNATLSEGTCAMIVNDADLIDEESWTAIVSACIATDTPLVTSLKDPRGQRGSDRSARKHLSTTITMHLQPLSFGATSELLLDRLKGQASLNTLSQVYQQSGGVPSIATGLVDAAVLSRRLAQTNGIWNLNGGLWDESMSGSVEHVLGDLSAEDHDVIEAIGLAGTLDLTVARTIADPDRLEAMESAGLLTTVDAGNRSLLSLNPPIAGEWVRHKTPSLRRKRVLESLQPHLPDSFEAASSAEVVFSTTNAGLSNAVAQERSLRLRRMRKACKDEPTFGNMLEYLEELMDGSIDVEVIEDLFARCANLTGPAKSHARLIRLRMSWLTYRKNDVDQALALISNLSTELEPYVEYLNFFAIRATIDVLGVPADIDERIAQLDRPHQAEKGWAVLTRAYVHVILGRSRTALEELESLRATQGSELAAIAQIVQLWARASGGDVLGVYDSALEELNVALARFDLRMTRELSLIAAACMIALGHYRLGRSLLGSIITLGEPAVGQERAQVGLLCYAAVFNTMAGRLNMAKSLAHEAERFCLPPGPFPGANIGGVLAGILNLRGERAKAVEIATACFNELLDRGYLLTAVDTGLISGSMLGLDEVLERTSKLVPQLEGTWRYHYLANAVALRNEDADAIEAGVEALVGDGRLALAQYALIELTRIRTAAGDTKGCARAAALTRRVVRLRHHTDVTGSRWLYSKQYELRANLTEREREIAFLAVSGNHNASIANALHISLRTVETHLSKVYQKLGVRNRAGLLDLPWDWEASR